jgi:hypothetical protein
MRGDNGVLLSAVRCALCGQFVESGLWLEVSGG